MLIRSNSISAAAKIGMDLGAPSNRGLRSVVITDFCPHKYYWNLLTTWAIARDFLRCLWFFLKCLIFARDKQSIFWTTWHNMCRHCPHLTWWCVTIDLDHNGSTTEPVSMKNFFLPYLPVSLCNDLWSGFINKFERYFYCN